MILGTDAPDALPLRRANRPAHLARVDVLKAQDRLLLVGPLPAVDSPDPGDAGFTGSLIVAQFDSLAAAQAWAMDDPYLHAGAWASVEVRPFLKVFP